MNYSVGDAVTLELQVRVDGVLVVPGSVTLELSSPPGSTLLTSYAPVASSTGLYVHRLNPDVPGTYHWRWVVTGDGSGAEEGSFTVLPWAGDDVRLTTVAQLRSLTGSTKNDVQLLEILEGTKNTDATYNLDRAAAREWSEQAASYAALVDMSESGSSRSMSQLHKNALNMAKSFEARLEASVPDPTAAATARTRVRSIERA